MSSEQMTQGKVYILDTNVLLHDPRAFLNFPQGTVGISIVVLEELEKFKKESSERGKNAREVVRFLDDLRQEGSLSKGVLLSTGGIVQVLFTPSDIPIITSLNMALADNEILLSALALKQRGYDVKFISKDLNARVKADVLGLASEDYLKGYVPRDEFYKGWVRVLVPSIQLKKEIPDDLIALSSEYNFMPNEYVLVEAQHNPYNNRVLRYVGGKTLFRPVVEPTLRWNLGARNPQQMMALDALFDPSIELVTLLGPAGTGKTFLALLAGLHQVMLQDMYRKILVSRPIVPLGPDIGYLPGDLQEKLYSWMQPIYDNIDVILHTFALENHKQVIQNESNFIIDESHKGKLKKKNGEGHKKGPSSTFKSVDELVQQGKLSLEAITYMRGRSIPYQFIFIDEVQNLSPHEVKTIISRVGQGSKIILCGDPYQIDSPYLDFSSNGLVIASDKFKDQSLFATVFLENSERSKLSQLAGQIL